MCGIAGVAGFDQRALQATTLQHLSRALYHRGPDDRGFLGWSGTAPAHLASDASTLENLWVGLVHCRLSILELSKAGWQPMGTSDGRYYIVFNGEIYNYRELRATLTSLGYTFRSQSDTEVLLTAYAHWNVDALSRLQGMFAFAILDTQAHKIFLARDFFGIKPLYYTYWQQGFAFASEIKALLLLPGVSRRVNPQRLYYYMRFGLTDYGGETLFADIYQLPPAHYLEISLTDLQRAVPLCYWHLDLNQRLDLSFEEAATYLRQLFIDNVTLHLRSDVPIGATLSGGIDSSAIVMAIRHIQGRDRHLHTFSYIADKLCMSEEPWVDMVNHTAQAIGHKVRPKAQEIMADVDTLAYLQDEPFTSTSIYAQMRVFRLAHETGIKVVLDGQGADEFFGGYRSHLAARLASLLKQRQWGKALRFLCRVGQLPDTNMLRLLVRALGLLSSTNTPPVVSRWLWHYLFPDWLNADWFAQQSVLGKPLWQAQRLDLLQEHLYQAVVENSLPMLLRYEDRNAMAFSIESRTPFLTPALAEFVFSLPEEYLIAADGTSKAVFRRAMRGLVPDAILDRRDKIGFATPEGDWLTLMRPWAEQLLYSETAAQIPALNLTVVQRQWQDLLTGQRLPDFRVWRWLNLMCWAQHWGVHFAS